VAGVCWQLVWRETNSSSQVTHISCIGAGNQLISGSDDLPSAQSVGYLLGLCRTTTAFAGSQAGGDSHFFARSNSSSSHSLVLMASTASSSSHPSEYFFICRINLTLYCSCRGQAGGGSSADKTWGNWVRREHSCHHSFDHS
jgi:hypothetical protein